MARVLRSSSHGLEVSEYRSRKQKKQQILWLPTVNNLRKWFVDANNGNAQFVPTRDIGVNR